MTFATLLLAAVTIAFPKEGQRLPAIARCYMIGATDGGETNLALRVASPVVRELPPVSVYRTGAWGTLLDVAPGLNVFEIGGVRRSFYVAKPKPSAVKRPAPAPSRKVSESCKTNAPAPNARIYEKLPFAKDEPKPHPQGRAASEVTVVLDAGHGGKDAGALSPHGRREKDANLALAQAVRQALTNRGYRVVMTRTGDAFPELYDRPKVAHRENADAFISIHHNAPPLDRDPVHLRYQTVYAWNEIGERLAKAINVRMAAANTNLTNNGVMHANFAVTRNPEIPSCLIEADFITSPEGEESAWDPSRVEAAASAIADGVADWTAGEK